MTKRPDPARAVVPDDFWHLGSALWDVYLAGLGGPAAIAATGRARLARLVRSARARSPFYARHLRGLRDDAPTLADLPTVGRRVLMTHFDDWATDREITRAAVERFIAEPERLGTPFAQRYSVWTSSGTTGEPGIYVQDAPALAVYDALEMVRFRRLLPAQWMGSACLFGDRYALLAATGGHFAGHATAARLARLNPWFRSSARVMSIMQPIDRIDAELDAFRPTLLATYPTMAQVLADEQAAGRLRLALRELWTGGEHLSPAVRARIERALGCLVRDAYGASECLAIAWDCGHGVLHVNADWVLLEPIDAHGRPAALDQPSHTTLITNLANHIQPLIRYDIGDRVTRLSAPCACGSPFPAILVEGRTDDVLAFRDRAGRTVKLLPLALATALEDDASVFGFQLVQVDAATIELRLDAALAHGDAVRRAHAALAALLQLHGLAHVRIAWSGRTPQRDARSGKLRRVIARRTGRATSSQGAQAGAQPA